MISNHAFSNNKPTTINIPNSFITIVSYAFSNNQITIVAVGNSVTKLETQAFINNPLNSVKKIPIIATTIGYGTFLITQTILFQYMLKLQENLRCEIMLDF
jgi:hypothetical protein